MMSFAKLFSPIQVGPLSLSNRIVMPAMSTRMASDTGGVTTKMIDYYRTRARGGVALIIVESSYACKERAPGHLANHSDHFIPGLNLLAESIKEENCYAFIQINHGGVLYGKGVNDLKKSEITGIIKDFGACAARAKLAGFDGVEIHGGNVYLIHQFLSPKVNRRKDEFGLGLEDRIKFPLQVLEECRKRVGDEFPIFFRLNADELTEGGWDLSQSKALAVELEKRAVTAINVTAGGFEARYWHVQPMALPRGCLVYLAKEIKDAVKVPVMAVGRINSPELAEDILQKNHADLICIGRGLVADPEFPLKGFRGESESINKCIACNYCRLRAGVRNLPIRCTVNPMAGREGEFRSERVKKRKKIWVVGGGPAGMTAARILDERGHDVTLFEARENLGGQVRLAALPPFKGELNNLLDFLIRSIRKSQVQVSLNNIVRLQEIRNGNPDAVVVATGVRPLLSAINASGIPQKTAWQILEEGPGKEQNYVVAGGGLMGCETAEFLADKGKTVTIVEILPEIGMEYEPHTRTLLLERFHDKGVKLLPGTEIIRCTDGKIHLRRHKNGKELRIDVDIVVLATGSEPEKGLYEGLRSSHRELYVIGDARDPRSLAEAIFEGTKVAYGI